MAAKKPIVPNLDPYRAAGEYHSRSLERFVREFWGEIEATPLVWAPHMTILCNEVEAVYRRMFMQFSADENGELVPIGRLGKLYDLVINIPPGTSKSTIVTRMAPAWGWSIDPSLRHITASGVDDLAMGHSKKCLSIINSDKYRNYYPDVRTLKGYEAAGDFTLTGMGQRYTTSTGASIIGVHADILTFDDLIDPQGVKSPAEVLKAGEWQDEASTRKTHKEKSATIQVAQRLSTEDPPGKMLAQRKDGMKIRHVNLPAILDDGVTPKEYRKIYTLFPASVVDVPEFKLLAEYKTNAQVIGLLDPLRNGLAGLKEQRIKLGAGGFAGQYQQRPVPKGGLIWQKWFIPVPDAAFPAIKLMTNYGNDWDLAYTKDDKNAASAVICSGVINSRIYVEDVRWDWFEFPKLIKWMKTFYGPHYIEAKASGKSAKQSLNEQKVVAIEVKVEGGADKVTRANLATPTAEAGMIYVRESILDRLYNDPKQGILFFPNGPCADVADVLAQMINRHSRGGRLVVAGNTSESDDVDPVDRYVDFDEDDNTLLSFDPDKD